MFALRWMDYLLTRATSQWINVYYGFGGAIVMFVALCYEADQSGLAAEEKRAAVREMA